MSEVTIGLERRNTHSYREDRSSRALLYRYRIRFYLRLRAECFLLCSSTIPANRIVSRFHWRLSAQDSVTSRRYQPCIDDRHCNLLKTSKDESLTVGNSINQRTEWIDVESIGLLHTEETRLHGERDQRASRTANLVWPFALLLFIIPEELMRTLTHIISARFANMIDIAVLFMRIGSSQSKGKVNRWVGFVCWWWSRPMFDRSLARENDETIRGEKMSRWLSSHSSSTSSSSF